ncbi:MAG TPA: DUF2085 domain-containing protein, partial [Thermomicrobiales bacterium]|nr:DUF2085 domain-containing protein [Thermomicrobiales bacterium]
VGSIVFFSSPGDYSGTAYAILHGLCAQTPSHTLQYGDRSLPFDSRMTGIYGGFLVTIAWLALSGRVLRFGNPSRHVLVVLILLVGAMAMDGFNSLFRDLGIWHPYEPANWLRVVTGFGTGVTLAIALSWLLASSLWHLATPDVGVRRVRELVVPLAGMLGYGALLSWRPEWMHLPVSVLLVLSAWLVVTLLALVIVLLAFRLDASVRMPVHLHVPVATASLMAIAIMLGLSGIRYWIERTLGISNAMM